MLPTEFQDLEKLIEGKNWDQLPKNVKFGIIIPFLNSLFTVERKETLNSVLSSLNQTNLPSTFLLRELVGKK